MLTENLKQITSVKEFNTITKVERKRLTDFGGQLSDLTASFGGDDQYQTLRQWRQDLFEALPDDVLPRVHVLTLAESEPVGLALETHLKAIRDHGSSPNVVRRHLEAAFAYMTPYAFFSRRDTQSKTEQEYGYGTAPVSTPLGESLSSPVPSSEPQAIFPILRAALPAALSVGQTLRTLGFSYQFVTARVARPDTGDAYNLTYFVDQSLMYIPSTSVEGAPLTILDPLIAAGGSIITAHRLSAGFKPSRVTVFSLCATAYGLIQVVRNLRKQGMDPMVYTADIGHLDAQGRVRPAFGDIGDRLHGEEERGKIRSLDELIGLYRPMELLLYQPEIDAIFKAAVQQTPQTLRPIVSPRHDNPADYGAGPAQS